MATLQQRLIKNSFFQTIPAKRQTRLLEGDDMFVDGRRNALNNLGWGEDLTKGVYKYLSNHAHSMPLAFHRTEFNRVYERDSPAAKVVAGFATEFGRKALGVGCLRMVALFPNAQLAFDPAMLAALQKTYAPVSNP